MEKNTKSIVRISVKRNELGLHYSNGQERICKWDGVNFMQQLEKLRKIIIPEQSDTNWMFAVITSCGETTYWLWHENFSPELANWASHTPLTESNMKDLMSNQKILGRIKEIFNVDFL